MEKMQFEKPKTEVQGIRLPPDSWVKFREVWRAKGPKGAGMDWFVRFVNREHRKLNKGK